MAPRDEDQDDARSPFARALEALGGRPNKLVEIPGMTGVKARIWCPNDEEDTEAEVEARKRLTGHHKMSALDLSLAQETELFERQRDAELFALVVRDADDPDEAFFESADEARKLSKPQRKALKAMIDDFQHERFQQRTPEQAAELVRLVRESKTAGVLSNWLVSCDADTLRELVDLLATDPDSTPQTTSNSSGD